MPTINANTDAITVFSRKLRRTYPEIAKSLRAEVAAVGRLVRDDARERASGFSQKIPPTIRSTASGNVATIKVGTAAKPLGALYERSKNFRHPVFGNRNNWVSQGVANDGSTSTPGPRQSLHQALEAQQETGKQMLAAAVDHAMDAVLGYGA